VALNSGARLLAFCGALGRASQVHGTAAREPGGVGAKDACLPTDRELGEIVEIVSATTGTGRTPGTT
jgi:hypothetical protein